MYSIRLRLVHWNAHSLLRYIYILCGAIYKTLHLKIKQWHEYWNQRNETLSSELDENLYISWPFLLLKKNSILDYIQLFTFDVHESLIHMIPNMNMMRYNQNIHNFIEFFFFFFFSYIEIWNEKQNASSHHQKDKRAQPNEHKCHAESKNEEKKEVWNRK